MSDNPAVLRLKRISGLLQAERDEDFRQYNEQFLRASLDQRRRNGMTWYPVKINNEEIGAGELLHVEIERTAHTDLPHQFASGKNVTLFGQSDETAGLTGTIKSVSRNVMRLVMHADELPDWCYDGKLGINMQFDDNSYLEMQKALETVIEARYNRTAELRDMIDGLVPIGFGKPVARQLPGLNTSQSAAVTHVLAASDIAVVHGPPGTGKTTSLVQAIRLTLDEERQVLVCAPTNAAVDVLTEKMVEAGLDVLRLGHPARISEALLGSSLDGRVSASSYMKEIRQLRKTAEEYFRMAGKYKRTFGREDAKQRAAFYAEARNCIREARQIEDYAMDELFRSAQVICCTPVTSTHRGLGRKKFKTLFFDEASQALEPMVWIPLLRCGRLILSGDHFQLPPVVKSQEAKAKGLDVTLLDRCMELPGTVALLKVQYRMNKVIMGFSNDWFYGGALSADTTVRDHVLVNDGSSLSVSLEFVDTAGCSFEEYQNPETLSYSNAQEGAVLIRHLEQLVEMYAGVADAPPITIGIISPYKEQREWLSENVPRTEREKVRSLAIKTIDGFQGEERDVIYISLVRSNERGEIGFLNDLRRMNVAITRARKKLVVIGDSSTIGATPFYKAFLEYCEKNGLYRTAWEFM